MTQFKEKMVVGGWSWFQDQEGNKGGSRWSGQTREQAQSAMEGPPRQAGNNLGYSGIGANWGFCNIGFLI